MTATTTASGRQTAHGATTIGRFPGMGGLVRKELREWRRARRTWAVLIVSTMFMTLSALNSWLQTYLPAEPGNAPANAVIDPLVNLVGAVSGQIFAVAAIFAVMSLIVGEREHGTLAWTASKPVSLGSIWLSKFGVAAIVLWVAAGLIPLIATAALVVTLYGPLPVLPVAIMGVGIGLSIVLYVAVALAVSTVIPNQAAVAGITLAVMFLPQLLAIVVPPELLPTSILQWSIVAAAGEGPGLATLVTWGATVALLIGFSVWRMEQLEL